MEPRLKAATRTDVFNSLTKQMALETADMEARLASLRSAMATEKAKREAALAHTNPAGSYWNNGAAGAIRSRGGIGAQQRQSVTGSGAQQHKERLPGQRSNSGSVDTRSTDARAASNHIHQCRGQNLTASATKATRICIAASYTATELDRNREQINKPRKKSDVGPTVAASKSPNTPLTTISALPDPRIKSKASDQPVTHGQCAVGIVEQSDTAPVRSSSRQEDDVADTHPRDNESLLYGMYDEAESRNSFLEALNEWRKAGKTSSPGTGSPADQQATAPGTSGCRAPAAAITVQTDHKAPTCMQSRGIASAADGVNSRSCDAGVCGPYFLKIWVQSSLKSGGTAADDVEKTSDDAIVPGHCQPDQGAPQQHDVQQFSAFVTENNPCNTRDEQLQQQQQQPQQHGIDTPAACDPYAGNLATAASRNDQPLCFDAWLQCAVQCVEEAVSATSSQPIRNLPNEVVTSATLTQHGDETQSSSTCLNTHMQQHATNHQSLRPASLCDMHMHYDQQLQLVLGRLEELEAQAQQQRGICAKSQPAGGEVTTHHRVADTQQSASSALKKGFVGCTAGVRLPDSVEMPEQGVVSERVTGRST